ncbi:Hypothetical predicted protein [Lecanosticta acicola]|uniref:DUF7730 domain-containing protein n=1 Tax=Lecanosticta acicola TaxID=111012 RepID=A0AAI8Z7M8_9PEZI|nr:Hypothetical predicted protein [Lecanosticta acicola]
MENGQQQQESSRHHHFVEGTHTDRLQAARLSESRTLVAADYDFASANGTGNARGPVTMYTDSGSGLTISGAGLGLPSKYDEDNEAYTVTITVTKKVPFMIKPVTEMSGDQVESHCLELRESKALPIVELPVEIRDMIYGYCVTDGEPISLRVYHRQLGSFRLVEKSFRASKMSVHVPKNWDPHAKKWTGRERDAFNMLQVSRQFHDETAKVLYQTNTFEFHSARALEMLIKRNPHAASYLRRVRIDDSWAFNRWQEAALKKIRLALKTLSRLDGLRSFTLSGKTVTEAGLDADDLVNKCVPVLNEIHRRCQQENVKAKILDALRVDDAALGREVKRVLAERFLLDYAEPEDREG